MGLAVHPASKESVDDWQLRSGLWDLNMMGEGRNLAFLSSIPFIPKKVWQTHYENGHPTQESREAWMTGDMNEDGLAKPTRLEAVCVQVPT